jgi:hypothetical protein
MRSQNPISFFVNQYFVSRYLENVATKGTKPNAEKTTAIPTMFCSAIYDWNPRSDFSRVRSSLRNSGVLKISWLFDGMPPAVDGDCNDILIIVMF